MGERGKKREKNREEGKEDKEIQMFIILFIKSNHQQYKIMLK
jgi:hypothetical protein